MLRSNVSTAKRKHDKIQSQNGIRIPTYVACGLQAKKRLTLIIEYRHLYKLTILTVTKKTKTKKKTNHDDYQHLYMVALARRVILIHAVKVIHEFSTCKNYFPFFSSHKDITCFIFTILMTYKNYVVFNNKLFWAKVLTNHPKIAIIFLSFNISD